MCCLCNQAWEIMEQLMECTRPLIIALNSLGHISRIFWPEVPAGHASISRSLIRRLIIQHNTKPVGPSSDLFALLKVQEIDCAYKHERRIIWMRPCPACEKRAHRDGSREAEMLWMLRVCNDDLVALGVRRGRRTALLIIIVGAHYFMHADANSPSGGRSSLVYTASRSFSTL